MCAFSEVKQRAELRCGMRYPGQRSLISALLQLDVYYRSARSTLTLSQHTHTHMRARGRLYSHIRDRWLREGKYFAACIRWYARICVNMGAIYIGMRGHNTSTNAREYIRQQERSVTSATKRLLGPLKVFLWSSFVRRARNGHESVMYSGTRISREY